ncbi:MAG: M23 family metallopeptidase [Bacteroidetes bacterium]|nr:MAG: M23 family metallopeptidase [Bacteroidota bacterium]
MPPSQFKFNPEDLRYDRLDDSLKARFWRFVIYVAAILVMAILLNVVYSLFFDTPGERQIRRENELLMEQYNSMSERKRRVDTVMKEVQQIDREIYRVIFETEPVDLREEEGAGTVYQALLRTADRQIVDETASRLDSLARHNRNNDSQYELLRARGEKSGNMLTYIPAIQPISNRDLTLIASGFGYRIHPIYKIRRMHTGIDFSAPVGTPVYATAGGVVEEATRSARGLGNRIVIDHGFGYKTVYAYMDEIRVKKGATVKRGDVIGTVGDSGLSVAPHLHYEIHLDGEPVNPINYFFLELDPGDYDRLILISMKSGQSFD